MAPIAPFSGNATAGWRISAYSRATLKASATGINNPGRVVGYSSGPRGTRAFLWTRNGGMEDLGTLPGGDFSRALAINEPGDIVGTSGSPLGARATLWPRGGGIQDLNALIPAGNDFVLTQAVNINNPGTILAIGHDDDGRGGSAIITSCQLVSFC